MMESRILQLSDRNETEIEEGKGETGREFSGVSDCPKG